MLAPSVILKLLVVHGKQTNKCSGTVMAICINVILRYNYYNLDGETGCSSVTPNLSMHGANVQM